MNPLAPHIEISHRSRTYYLDISWRGEKDGERYSRLVALKGDLGAAQDAKKLLDGLIGAKD